MQYSSPIALATAGFRYAKRLVNGLYIGKDSRRGASHIVKARRANPRLQPLGKEFGKDAWRGVYADEQNPITFIGEGARARADAWLASRKELVKQSIPLSAVTIPVSAKHKTTDQRLDASPENMAKKTTPAKPTKKAPKAPAAPKDIKNGITRPKTGTTCAKIFDLADKHKERAPVLEAAEKLGINAATATTQYGKWRVYNGITGRTAKVTKVVKKKPAPPKPPAKKKAAPKPPAPPAEPAPTEGDVGGTEG
jgi:hypothetical protein